ncbi:2-amino-4-hydroxy-6-hydroxymethyldihydropteridine diphosphokinase [Emcibacter sp.]|uniref:2-amino-4-hydroxy-6- hydroxymethyldihydropteridine diphosphokinase n=1 Tax=Emcibacter sp. TaxID=1979954 RepID=UPI002AA8E20E|nr:2-amino-4-hydroxy-6-hydroxymethyldihydropteridine diphosphokinase [Emcibacter sp.]
MILIGFGGNLPSPEFGAPANNIRAAMDMLSANGVVAEKISGFYETEPVPASDQPWYVNAVASVSTPLGAGNLLELLHRIEHDLGRVREKRWEARLIDLDLLAYNDEVLPSGEDWLAAGQADLPGQAVVPHPRLHLRSFVLVPLMDIAPDWFHPVLKKTARELLSELEDTGNIRKLAGQN